MTTAKEETGEQPAASAEQAPPPRRYRRIGHKGADTIVEGNTIESFEAGDEHGAEMIEFDVLRTREGRLIVAHDHIDASNRQTLSLNEALDAFKHPPLDKVEFDCDLKLPGREAELAGVLSGHGLLDRAMVSTMEVESLVKLRSIDPDLRLGWTIPKTRRDWTRDRWARPALGAGLALLRRRLPKMIVERAPELDIDAIWAYQQLVTPEAVEAAAEADVELIAWTVDEPERVAELAALGVDGIVSNDPRILS
jgi:glycerophosphoryl diester phosphodiesterase